MDVPLTRRQILFYDYVREDVLERRAPHREAHIALVREWTAGGRILMSGALGDPPHGAALVFASDDPTEAERFTKMDPYVTSGVVTAWRVELWNVVS
ncbi:MAG: YciI family protein [Thermoleophilaceae bacterium]